MRDMVHACVTSYSDLTGAKPSPLRHVDTPFIPAPPVGGDAPAEFEREEGGGTLADVACSVLMNSLYAARLAR